MRIRTVKPEVCTSLTVAALPNDSCRLHWEHLWLYADDEGRGLDDVRLLKAALWPLDDKKSGAVINGFQQSLADAGLIRRYYVRGRRYFQIVNWAEHQRIDRPKPSVLPTLEEEDGTGPTNKPPGGIDEQSTNGHGTLDDASSLEGKGREQGREGITPPTPHAAPSTALAIPDDTVPQAAPNGTTSRIFHAWCQSTGRDPTRTKLDTKRRKLIAAALGGYPVDDVLAAVQGWVNLAHNRGDNDRHTVYNDLSLLLRDPEHIEKYRDAWQKPAPLVGLSSRYDGLRVLSGEGA